MCDAACVGWRPDELASGEITLISSLPAAVLKQEEGRARCCCQEDFLFQQTTTTKKSTRTR